MASVGERQRGQKRQHDRRPPLNRHIVGKRIRDQRRGRIGYRSCGASVRHVATERITG